MAEAIIARRGGGVKLPEGITEIAYGTFTPAGPAYNSVTIQHGMSDAPTGFIIWRTTGGNTGIPQIFYPAVQTSAGRAVIVTNTTNSFVTPAFASGEVTITSSNLSFASQPYYWIMWR